jgi:hypothetical protein
MLQKEKFIMDKKIKMRKISYRLGDLDWIEVPNDWRKAEGIIVKRTETNAFFAHKDYSVICKSDSEPLMVVEGYWLWWCETHHQPLFKCEMEKFKKEVNDLLMEFKENSDCKYDHNGYCQEHSFLKEGKCPQEKIKDFARKK